MSSLAHSLQTGEPTPDDDGPATLMAAMSAMQTADALLRWRLRDRLTLRANEIMALEFVMRLDHLREPVRATDVANALGVSRGASTIILARLVERGYLTRTSNPRDGRGHHFHFTEVAAREVAEAVGDPRHEIDALVSGLSPRESRRITALLIAITGTLDRGGVVQPT